MKPFRTSLTARMVSASIALALLGGGLTALVGSGTILIPITLLLSIGGCIAALVMGVQDYPGPVTLLAIFLPLALWPYSMALIAVCTSYQNYAYALLALGALALGSTVVATMTTRPQAQAAPSSVRAVN